MSTYTNPFDSVQTEIELLDPDESAERDQFENQILSLKSQLLERRFQLTENHDFSDSRGHRDFHVDVSNYQDLPPIALPTFSGNYLD